MVENFEINHGVDLIGLRHLQASHDIMKIWRSHVCMRALTVMDCYMDLVPDGLECE